MFRFNDSVCLCVAESDRVYIIFLSEFSWFYSEISKAMMID